MVVLGGTLPIYNPQQNKYEHGIILRAYSFNNSGVNLLHDTI